MAAEKPILIIRLGAMGDIIHALPAAASLKLSFPDRKLVWLAARKWLPLFEGNPSIDTVIEFERKSFAGLSATWKRLRVLHPGIAIDFQGLIQSAAAGRVAAAGKYIGLAKGQARERAGTFFYTTVVDATGPHRVERGLQLAQAAGATKFTEEAWMPQGCPRRQPARSTICLGQSIRRLGQANNGPSNITNPCRACWKNAAAFYW